ncbi:ankyrin repeat domain-containing protein [Cellulophaga lytica]|uniref:ankyrin repeat domain-containing protein n=1 Tax=Cellulophaga lytica TaxID=979 RepID=UPI0026E2A2D0|nr:ankyrin repeat domain-containing protein [Cellulophaga lytica]MDO6853678.1 ankyrin repeat domain-containing protein [Cellulophaga lytica]
MEEYNLIIEELKKPTEKVDWKYIEKTLPEIKINTLNPSGENLLFLFSSCKAPILIYSKALDLGINPNQKNSRYGRTCAFYIKDIRVLELLVKYGLNINHLDDSGWTFAHYNINNFDILSFAMNSGLDISIKNKLGRNIMFTLIEDVRQNDFEKYLQILIDFGADINIKDKFGITPIHYSVIVSNISALSALANNLADTKIPLSEDFMWEYGGEPNINLKKGTTIFDTVKSFGNWTKNITDNIGGEWVDEKKEDYSNYRRILKIKKKWWKF